MIFLFKTLRESKVRAAKDHGKSSEVGLPPLLAESSIPTGFPDNCSKNDMEMKF